MEFFTAGVGVLKTLVTAIGAVPVIKNQIKGK